jgi:hypothetical protein
MNLEPSVGQSELERIIREQREEIIRLKHGSDSGWIYPSFSNGWTNYGSGFTVARYRRTNGEVQFQGLVVPGTLGAVVFTVLNGFKPSGGTLLFECNTNGTASRADVDTAGQLTIHSGSTFVSLSQIRYPLG